MHPLSHNSIGSMLRPSGSTLPTHTAVTVLLRAFSGWRASSTSLSRAHNRISKNLLLPLTHILGLGGLALMSSLALVPCAAAQTMAGQVIFVEDFGSGAFPTGQPLDSGVTNFTFNEPAQPADFNATLPNDGIVADGFYTIANNTQQAFSNWANIEDNTPGDINGLMLVVNGRENELVDGQIVEDEFFRQTVTLTPNTKFDFLASLVPTNSVADEAFCQTNFGGLILPNVRFSIQEPDGTILAEMITGDIPFSATPGFEEFQLTFATSPMVSEVQLVLSNIAPGGCGNDIAIDDIIFRISITATATDDTANITDAAMSNPAVLNVVSNDMLDGAPFPAPDAPASNTTLLLAPDVSLPPELTFDPATGNVGIIGGSPNGTFSFDYQVCETALAVNCDTATVQITIGAPEIPMGNSACPVGQTSLIETGFAVNAFTSNGQAIGPAAAPNAIGEIAPDGTVDTGVLSVDTFFANIDLDFTGNSSQLIPQNSVVVLSVAQFFGEDALALVQSSIDGVTFTDIGTIGFGNTTGTLATLDEQNTLTRVPINMPEDGIRYIRLDHQAGGFRVDGGQRNEICQDLPSDLEPQLAGSKNVKPWRSPVLKLSIRFGSKMSEPTK